MSVVDTNILVHVSDPFSPEQVPASRALAATAALGPVAITRQIMREYVAVMTRPQPTRPALTMADAMALLAQFAPTFDILEDGEAVWIQFQHLARTISFAGKQVHDANIVATMLAHGERLLLTHNAKDFRRFEPLIQVITP